MSKKFVFSYQSLVIYFFAYPMEGILGKNLSNFVSPDLKLCNPYCHDFESRNIALIIRNCYFQKSYKQICTVCCSSQSNFNIQSPVSYLVRSYLITAVLNIEQEGICYCPERHFLKMIQSDFYHYERSSKKSIQLSTHFLVRFHVELKF